MQLTQEKISLSLFLKKIKKIDSLINILIDKFIRIDQLTNLIKSLRSHTQRILAYSHLS